MLFSYLLEDSLMNKVQRIAVLIGAMVFVSIGMVPPWRTVRGVYDGFPVYKGAGYSLLYAPPESGASVDVPRLCIQWAILIVVVAVTVLLSKDETTAQNI